MRSEPMTERIARIMALQESRMNTGCVLLPVGIDVFNREQFIVSLELLMGAMYLFV